MALKQSRRCVSVSGLLYRELQQASKDTGKSMASIAEHWIRKGILQMKENEIAAVNGLHGKTGNEGHG